MSLGKPIWKNSLGPFLIRIPLGVYLFLAGLRKFQSPDAFVEVVKQFHILPDQIAVLYGVLLPYAEMLGGFLLFFGFLTTFAASLSSLVLLSVVIAVGVTPPDNVIFNKD